MMKPILGIVDIIENRDGVSVREKTVFPFGLPVSKRVECYPLDKNRPVGFTCGETNLTYVDDE